MQGAKDWWDRFAWHVNILARMKRCSSRASSDGPPLGSCIEPRTGHLSNSCFAATGCLPKSVWSARSMASFGFGLSKMYLSSHIAWAFGCGASRHLAMVSFSQLQRTRRTCHSNPSTKIPLFVPTHYGQLNLPIEGHETFRSSRRPLPGQDTEGSLRANSKRLRCWQWWSVWLQSFHTTWPAP